MSDEMVSKKVEYLVAPKEEYDTATITELFDSVKRPETNIIVLKINDNSYHVTVDIECEKNKMGFVMKALKKFDKEFNEDIDSQVTMKQIENMALDDNNPKKKRDWKIPDNAFDDKSEYGVYKL